MLMARGTREGILAARPERRPFVLTRANHLGGQRYAAAWTGDNVADADHMAMSVPMVLNLGLSGQPFAGPDIGGYKGYGSPELYARWLGFGALLPFARSHTEKGVPAKEPWAFGPAVTATARRAIEARYRLMPYLYSVFREAAVTGLPVARPVFFADPSDPRLRTSDDAFLLGRDLLVAADMELDRPLVPVLPKGDWGEVREFNRDESGARDPDLPRCFQRPGSIVTLGPRVQYVDERPLDTLDVLVCLDDAGTARGVLYEDAGDGHGHTRGEYRLTGLSARVEQGRVRVTAERRGGDLPFIERPIRVTIVERQGQRTPRSRR
jgi:alpha-glucosidase